ncbi:MULTISPECIES: SdpI family protein [Mesonia]|uniref:Uncharacterized protein n=1 Tax=Mesonia oceanica TaxID=2687242 RepID=A0AC61YC77_9FLAO|nr:MULTISPECIES: SdpI family protein [Mesonia]MAN27097.1 hypothetical protein [Mesonia sp.]MAQ41984.1 hypothetical protein [Mesonia sp.]MBJ97661.1 hypothetical protein [Flavobacteriaceae bacterium]VVV02084.1 hypothetical protein FVB9532_03380 [Mesonia oceanica]|tara:strand:- start:11234 stop:11584 length:351 start_codon:yes stop_codon:yes gene_type:complete
MERLENPFTIPLLICGMIFFVVGLLLLFFPPKKINSLYGYRTPNSMKSQERWDFSQKYSSNLMWKCGVGIALLSLLGLVLPDWSSSTQSVLVVFVLLVPIIIIFWKTEKAIKNKFE